MLLHTAARNSYVYEKIWFLHSLFVSVQNDSLAALKKARHQYFQRCEELEKAKAISAKSIDDAAGFKTLDKRRKSKDEAQNKVRVPSNRVPGFKNELFCIRLIPPMCFHQMMEAELQYRQCLNDAKFQQDELVRVKERIISHIRKLICQGDTVLKEVGVQQGAVIRLDQSGSVLQVPHC